jgi:hypothetical protein
MLYVALVIGQGPPPLWPLSIQTLLFCLLALCLAGLLIAWRWELAGGLTALVGIAGFYLVHFAESGFARFPGGWVFPSLFVTALLFVVSGVFRNQQQKRLSAGVLPSA